MKDNSKNLTVSYTRKSSKWRISPFNKKKTGSRTSGRTVQGPQVQAIDYSEYHFTKKVFLKQAAAGIGLCALTAFTFYRSILVFVLLLPAGAIIFPLSRKEHLKKQRLWELTLEFREAIWLVSGFLSAGYSVENAFFQAVPELTRMYGQDSMIVTEFLVISNGIRLNRPVEALLADFAVRSGSDDIRSFASVFSIARRSGGSMKDIIENTANVIRDKTSVSEEIKTMTASRRYEQNIMNLLPFAIIVYVNMTSDGFLDVMYESLAGRIIMTVCLIITGISYMLSRKILDIKV